MTEAPRHPRLAMLLPTLRVAVRRARHRQGATDEPTEIVQEIDHHGVVLPLGGTDQVVVDGRIVGVADVRHEPGTSTIEVWSDLTDTAGATAVAGAVLALADDVGAHRISWSLQPGSVDQAAAAAAGLTHQGPATPPLDRRDIEHELWSVVLPS